MGGAFVGIADDATAVYHNPAAITQQTKNVLYIGGDSLITNLDYTPTGGVKESAEKEFLVVPSFSFIYPISQNTTFGLGVFFPHGNGGKFATPSAAPGNPLEGQIFSMELAPTLAYKTDFGLSLGASFRVVRIDSGIQGQNLSLIHISEPTRPY